jgi:hypothetical protein
MNNTPSTAMMTEPSASALEADRPTDKVHNNSDTDHSSHHEDIEDGITKLNAAPREKKTKKFIILVAICAALGGLIFGYDIAGAGATFIMTGFRVSGVVTIWTTSIIANETSVDLCLVISHT